MKGRSLALFDFDGTITTTDSLIEFICFVRGKVRFFLGLVILSPVLVAYKMGLIPNWKAKEILLSYFLKGMREVEFRMWCERFTHEVIPYLIRERAAERIRQHVECGDRVVVVSASPEAWIGPWARANNLEWIGTRMDICNNCLSGKFFGKNCHGEEKVERVRSYLELSEYTEIYTYGDSKGDLPLINLGTHRNYRPSRD